MTKGQGAERGAPLKIEDPQCDPDKTAGANKLILTRPSGNNHSWFTHGSDARPQPVTTSQAVLKLLGWHYDGPSGRWSSREVGRVRSASAGAGPLRTTLSYHPERRTLFETLLAGLVPPKRDVKAEADLCPLGVGRVPQSRGPAACCERAVLPADLVVRARAAAPAVPRRPHQGEGLVHHVGSPAGAQSAAIRRLSDMAAQQAGRPLPRLADSHRALWRDLDALLLIDLSGTAQPRRPSVFDWAVELSADMRVRALGFAQDGQAKDFQFVDAVTPRVLAFAERKTARTIPQWAGCVSWVSFSVTAWTVPCAVHSGPT
ncbi:type I-E CRISPR-associated protein Cse1/CasA [Streptomyces sp. NPDC019396]|uniref:type I-E CRISPR-associated protein Cse1/CasA n=1 Tax=Streptomyces sp. NPDC019396 TaxID=3154687 RepID=UPI0033D95FEA